MPQPVNPDTHCPSCGEVLSAYGHCWQHHYPPMDPSQDSVRVPSLAHLSPESARTLEQATLTQIGRHIQQARAGELEPSLALAVLVEDAAYLLAWVKKLTRAT